MNKISSFRGDFSFLSNFYNAPIEYGGIKYQNNEPAFQAQKCADAEEGNTWGDRIWGTVNGQGSNLLGKILMLTRVEMSMEHPIPHNVSFICGRSSKNQTPQKGINKMLVTHTNGTATDLRILTNAEMEEAPDRSLKDIIGYDPHEVDESNYEGHPATWTVVIPDADPLYWGTFSECCEYLRNNYTRAEAKELDAQLALQSLDDNFCTDYCYDALESNDTLDEVYGEEEPSPKKTARHERSKDNEHDR